MYISLRNLISKKRYHDGPDYNEHETSAINLTTLIPQPEEK